MGIDEVIVLDTHVLIWAVTGASQLGRAARRTLDKHWRSGAVAVPAIVFWEIGLLTARRRLRLPTALAEWRTNVLGAGAKELALDGAVAIRALDLMNLHDDPADRFIVATALSCNGALMTADERLLNWRGTLQRHDARE